MSESEQEPEAARNSKVDDFVENTIASVVEFGLCYVNTIWTFLRWPFKSSLGILKPGAQSRISQPLSFLFVSSSIFYLASELFIKLLQIGRKWKPNPDDLSPFSDIAWNTYTLDAFALYTAPIIVIVIIFGKICGWTISREPATRKQTRTMVLYLSGYSLLMLSAVIFAIVLAVAEIVSAIAIPGHVVNGPKPFIQSPFFHLLQYLLYAFLIYLFISTLVVIVSFSRAASVAGETMRRFARYALVRFLTMCTVVILCIPSGIAGTSYLILKNMRSAPDIELSGVMVIKKDASALARQELPMSVAVTNTSEKTMVLFTFMEMTARLWADEKPKQELKYSFKLKSVNSRFIELQPHGVVTIDGVLVKHDAQRQAWLDDNRQRSISMTLSLVGGYQKERPFNVFHVTAANYWKNGYRHGGLFLTGFNSSNK